MQDPQNPSSPPPPPNPTGSLIQLNPYAAPPPPPPADPAAPPPFQIPPPSILSPEQSDAARIISDLLKAAPKNLADAVRGKSGEDAATAVRDLHKEISKDPNAAMALIDAGFLPGEDFELRTMPRSGSARIAARALTALKLPTK